MTYQRHSGSRQSYARYMTTIFGSGPPAIDASLDTNTVYLAPIQIPYDLTIDRLYVFVTIALGNIRLGIYADNGDTPVGGVLLAESASTVAVADKNEVAMTVATLRLRRGLYWVGINNDNIGLRVVEGSAGYAGGAVFSRNYVLAYGAFTNPCPAAAARKALVIGVRVVT